MRSVCAVIRADFWGKSKNLRESYKPHYAIFLQNFEREVNAIDSHKSMQNYIFVIESALKFLQIKGFLWIPFCSP